MKQSNFSLYVFVILLIASRSICFKEESLELNNVKSLEQLFSENQNSSEIKTSALAKENVQEFENSVFSLVHKDSEKENEDLKKEKAEEKIVPEKNQELNGKDEIINLNDTDNNENENLDEESTENSENSNSSESLKDTQKTDANLDDENLNNDEKEVQEEQINDMENNTETIAAQRKTNKDEKDVVFFENKDMQESKFSNHSYQENPDYQYHIEKLNNDYNDGYFNEEKARFFAFFAKSAKCQDRPTKLYYRGYKFFSAQSVIRENIYPYKTFIHVSGRENRVVVSLGGPVSVTNTFYNKLYSQKFEWIAEHRIFLEKEFFEIYYTHIRDFLIKKITQLKFLGLYQPEYVFTGHSIAGSLAMYAAYDLAKSGIINSVMKKPIVFAFGALRIGDVSFATQINQYAYIWRITKQTDYLPRSPTCYFCSSERRWKCKTEMFQQKENYSYNINNNKYILYNPNPEQKPESDLNRNVFDRNEKVIKNYSVFYTIPFDSNSKYYTQYISKKDDLLHLYFNVDNQNVTYNQRPVEEPKYTVKPEIADPNKKDQVNYSNSKEYNQDSVVKRKNKKLTKKRKVQKETKTTNNSKFERMDKAIPQFLDTTKWKNQKLRTKSKYFRKNKSFKALNKFKQSVTFLDYIKSKMNLGPNTQLSDLNKYNSNYVYFTPPIGRQVFYTYDGKVLLCKRTYFGASTCEIQYQLPKYFYSTSSHNYYLGIDFGDCNW